MTVHTEEVTVGTRGDGDMHDVTGRVERAVASSTVRDGVVVVSVVGSTAGITTIEYEPGLAADLNRSLDRIAPADVPYEHDKRWGDGNGHSHVRASLMGPSLTLPIMAGKPVLGTWQQIVLVDFDTRERTRRVVVQVVGE
ncbi:secondary thiamine-phosphate synthase enzyme YjbQ [Chloroflexota bacterium]